MIPRVEEFMNTFPFLLDGNPEEPAGRKPSQSRGVDEHIPAGWHGNQEEPEKKEETEKEAENDDLDEENEDTEPDIDTRLETRLETILDKAKNTAEDIPDHHSDEKEDHHSDKKEDHHSDVNESVDIFLVAGRETKPETTNHENEKAKKDEDIYDTTEGVELDNSDKLPALQPCGRFVLVGMNLGDTA